MKLGGQLLRFLIVGGAATALHYALYLALLGLGLAPVPASSIGFIVSAGFNYLLNRHYTFASGRAHREALPRFALTAAGGLGLNAAVVGVLTGAGLHPLPAQVLATVATLGWNFVVNRLWTFRAATPQAHKDEALP